MSDTIANTNTTVHEIEIKAHITDNILAIVYEKLQTHCHFVREYHKIDHYFLLQCNNSWRDFRIRHDKQNYIITTKNRTMRENIEINNETEFIVTQEQYNNFTAWIQMLGAIPWFQKEKKGLAYQYNNTLIEISHINTIGYYIELEQIAPIAHHLPIYDEFLSILTLLHIPENMIETRNYAELLHAHTLYHTITKQNS